MSIAIDTDYDTPEGIFRMSIVYDKLIFIGVAEHVMYIPLSQVEEIGMVATITASLNQVTKQDIPSLMQIQTVILRATKYLLEK